MTSQYGTLLALCLGMEKLKLILTFVGAFGLTACGQYNKTGQDFESRALYSINDKSAQLSESDSCLNLGKGALIALAGSETEVKGRAYVGGDSFVSNNSDIFLAGNIHIDGGLYTGDNVVVKAVGKVKINDGINLTDTSVLNESYNLLALEMSKMQATQTYSDIDESTTILGNGGLNIINVMDDIELAGKKRLILKGDSQDTFVINVFGNVHLTGKSLIETQGVSKDKILFNLIGDGSAEIKGRAWLVGTILAADRSLEIAGKSYIEGSLVAGHTLKIAGSARIEGSHSFCLGEKEPTPDPSKPDMDMPAPQEPGSEESSSAGPESEEPAPTDPSPGLQL